MAIEREIYPQITRPGEYVAFFNLKASTLEGEAYIFLACDGFSEFGFSPCALKNEQPNTVFYAVSRLMEDPDFLRHSDKGFTLVFDRWEELAPELEAIVSPVRGKILFHKGFNHKISKPLRETMQGIL